MRSLITRSIAAMALLALAAPTPAGELAQPLDQLSRTVFDAREGAPSRISSLAQSKDGFLWIATSSGLFRHDGATFARFEPSMGEALPDVDITVVKTAPDGDVWAATRYGFIYRFSPDGRLRIFGAADGLGESSVMGLAFDAQGKPWVASGNRGLLRFDGTRWVGIPGPGGLRVSGPMPDGLQRDRQGRLWYATGRAVYRLDPGAGALALAASMQALETLFLDREGNAWVKDERRVFMPAVPGSGTPMAELAALLHARSPGSVSIGFIDGDGNAWGRVDDRRFRVSAAWLRGGPGRPADPGLQLVPTDRREGAPSYYMAYLQDREGDVWIGTQSELARFHGNKFTRLDANGAALDSPAFAVNADGTLWIGAAQAPALASRQGAADFVTSRHAARFTDTDYNALLAARDGSLYIGTNDNLFHLVGDRLEELAPPPGIGKAGVQAVAEGDAGDLWISAVARGVYRRRGGAWVRDDALGLDQSAALSLQSDGAKRVWIGYPDSLAALVDGDRVRRFGPADGLDVGHVLAFLPEARGTWVGGVKGVAFFDGARFHPVRDARGGRIIGVSGLVGSPDGDVWINGEAGVTRLPAAEVARFVKDPRQVLAATETFGLDAGIEGLPATFRPLPSALAMPDGRLLFATSSGLYQLDPRHLQRNPVAPHVEIVDVRRADRRVAAPPPCAVAARTRAPRHPASPPGARRPSCWGPCGATTGASRPPPRSRCRRSRAR